MNKTKPTFLTNTFGNVSSLLLNNPYIFNSIRNILAGDQENTKQFVHENLIKYKCKTVLDLGCGTGDFAAVCPQSMKYIGTDLNERFITFAKNKYRKDTSKTFLEEDILSSKREKKFDAVLLISMMHHFSDEDFITILKKVKKITNKIVIIADIIPDAPYLIQRISAKMDQGKYVRTSKDKVIILKKHFKIAETKIINSRIAVQFGVVCEV